MEVKYTKLRKPEFPRSFRNFLAKYKPKNGYVIHLGERFDGEAEGTKIYTIPFHGLNKLNL